jgi:hypothetical protein
LVVVGELPVAWLLTGGLRFFDRLGSRHWGEHFGYVEIVGTERIVGGVDSDYDGGGEKDADEKERCDEDAAAGFEVGAVQIGFNESVEHIQFLLNFLPVPTVSAISPMNR